MRRHQTSCHRVPKPLQVEVSGRLSHFQLGLDGPGDGLQLAVALLEAIPQFYRSLAVHAMFFSDHDRLGIPRRLVTFQVMRRTLGTDLQRYGTMKDAQQILRHASIRTTANVYMQQIPASVVAAINADTCDFGGWKRAFQ
jgi:hypothetical protein